MAAAKVISLDSLKRHNQETDAWLAVNGKVWDVTGFPEGHPGGESIIREYFGRDASEPYNEIHGPRLISAFLGDAKLVGVLEHYDTEESDKNAHHVEAYRDLPPIESMLNLYDFEELACRVFSERAHVYVSGASNDCITMTANADWYRRIFFRPRILREVTNCDTSKSVLGVKLDVPVLNAPASLVKLVHPDGELAIAKGAVSMGTSFIVPTMSSYSPEEIAQSVPKDQPFFFQLYFNPNRVVTRKLLEDVCKLNPKAIVITVDLPVFSKREANERYEAKIAATKAEPNVKLTSRKQSRSASQTIASNIQWGDVRWVQEITGLPVIVKGIQCAEDAKLALENGCEGIYISNHGGRAADTAVPSILTLLEIRARYLEVLENMVVLIDGGIRRGSDVLKAICLGADAVCLGRPLFHAAVYGQEGIKHAIESKSHAKLVVSFVG